MSTSRATTMALPESPLGWPLFCPAKPEVSPFPMLMTRSAPSLRDDRRGIRVEIDHDVARAHARRGAGHDVRDRILIEMVLRALQLADGQRVHGASGI